MGSLPAGPQPAAFHSPGHHTCRSSASPVQDTGEPPVLRPSHPPSLRVLWARVPAGITRPVGGVSTGLSVCTHVHIGTHTHTCFLSGLSVGRGPEHVRTGTPAELSEVGVPITRLASPPPPPPRGANGARGWRPLVNGFPLCRHIAGARDGRAAPRGREPRPGAVPPLLAVSRTPEVPAPPRLRKSPPKSHGGPAVVTSPVARLALHLCARIRCFELAVSSENRLPLSVLLRKYSHNCHVRVSPTLLKTARLRICPLLPPTRPGEGRDLGVLQRAVPRFPQRGTCSRAGRGVCACVCMRASPTWGFGGG